MFGGSGSPSRETTETSPTSPITASALSPSETTDQTDASAAKKDSIATTRKGSEETPEKKRRSSAASKATAFLANAKHSLHLSHSSTSSSVSTDSSGPAPSAMQKLGKMDPALSVPQGSFNNSAGESLPGPHSTFRVGVTEDKNKKCRRTMEDTHAYLYNFLSTPAPVIDSDGRKNSTDVPEPASTKSESAVIETDNGYFAIFDGHAGTFAADWCGKKLHVLLEDLIRKNPNSAIPELLDQTFTSVDQQLQKLPLKNSGCTAICAVLRWEDRIPNPQSATGSTAIAPVAAAVAKANESADKSNPSALVPHSIQSLPANITPSTALPKLQESATRQRVLYTANVGDARIVLCRNGKALRLSYDHKGSDENEGRRITNAGGLILNNRVNGVLAVTRALGDAYMKELITGHPYTTETVIQPDIDEFLILACDGLWDVCTDQDAVDLIRNTHDPQAASKQLVDHALARFSTDNLSCMVVRFDNRALKETIEHSEGRLGVEGDPLSSRGSMSEADHLVYEARKSLSLPEGTNTDEQLHNVAQDIIKEEREKEAGPELDPVAGAAQH